MENYPCQCSDLIVAWHEADLVPLRQEPLPATASMLASRACNTAERLFGERFDKALHVVGGRMILMECPQLLYTAAVACAEDTTSKSAVSLQEDIDAESIAFWVRVAGVLVKAAKAHCIDDWIQAGVPSVAISEVQWNVEQHAMRPDAFRWHRWSVPAYLDESWPAKIPAKPGLLMVAAAAWAYDGAEVGNACRGGDLGCSGDGHCYALALDRALATWSPARRNASTLAPVRLLELGVCAGHSLATWQEYLEARFRESHIVAVDLDLQAYKQHLAVLQEKGFAAERVSVLEANLWTLGFGAALDQALESGAPFDLIVDDASHIDEEVAAAFDRLFFDELLGLAPGGVYIVLDTQASYRSNASHLAFFKQLADEMQWAGTTVVSAEQLELFVAHTGSKVEAWVEAVEFHRGLVLVRKRGLRTDLRKT